MARDEADTSGQGAGERAVAERSRDPNASHLEKSLALAQGLAEGFAEESRKGDLAGALGAASQQAQQTVQEGQVGLRRGMPPSEGRGQGGALSSKIGQASDAAASGAETLALLAQQAREAPAAIAAEVRHTVDEVMGEARKTILGGVAALILGLFGVFMLSYGAAVYLDGVWGAPWGFVAVALVYFLGAAIAAASAKSGAEGARREAAAGLERVKGEVTERAAKVQGRRGAV